MMSNNRKRKDSIQPLMRLICLLVLYLLLTKQQVVAQSCKQVIGYYPNWQWYDRNKLVRPQTIDYSKYTIINYSFFDPQPSGKINSTDAWADENLLLGERNWSTGGYHPNTSLIDLAHNNGVSVLAAVGGWTLSTNFSTIAADASKRDTFAQACVDLIQRYHFDGIDIDWEYPGYTAHNGQPQDKANYTLLLRAIRNALDAHGVVTNRTYLLTTCVGAGRARMVDIEWQAISPLVDAINLMSYDFFGAWDQINNHNAALNAPTVGDPTFNMSAAVEHLIYHYGVDPQKINAGVAFYGRSQRTVTTPILYGPSTGQGDNATFSADLGTPLYYNILSNINAFNVHWDTAAKVPYLIGINGLNTFVSYDDEQSIGLKAAYIMDENLQGAIIWEITGDYIETSAGSGQISGTPLADTLNQVFCNYSPILSQHQLREASPLITAYPNPTQGRTTLQLDAPYDRVEVMVYDILGKQVQHVVGRAIQTLTIDLDRAVGVYFVTVRMNEHQEATLTLLKQLP